MSAKLLRVSLGVGIGRPQLELELIQTHMTQKPMLRVEVGAVSAHGDRFPQCFLFFVSIAHAAVLENAGRLNFLDLLLRHNALVGGHPGPRKKADEHSSTR